MCHLSRDNASLPQQKFRVPEVPSSFLLGLGLRTILDFANMIISSRTSNLEHMMQEFENGERAYSSQQQ